MKITFAFILLNCCLLAFVAPKQDQPGEWISLFDGKTLNGWKVGDHPESFSVKDGMIKAHGDVAHLFYDGKVNNHDFKNFEFKADVMTMAGSNSGIFFHTTFQDSSWARKGYEVQINNTHTDWIKTGSLYGIDDVQDVLVKDSTWFNVHFTVQGKHVTVNINDKMVVDYTEPENPRRDPGAEERLISHGTFALQGHDPNSTVYFKNLMVKILPD
jgi:hypothetical protein